jgi:hypothetical protein
MGLPEVSDRSILRDFCKQQMDMGNNYTSRQLYHRQTKHIIQNHFNLANCAHEIKQHITKQYKEMNYCQCKEQLPKLSSIRQLQIFSTFNIIDHISLPFQKC